VVDESTTTSDGDYQHAEYVITFSYSDQGKIYVGKYKAGSPEETGHTFEILYDPSRPESNTGSDVPLKPWVKVIVWVAGGALTFLIVWLSNR
jgi:hypothetical protein